MNMIKPDMLKVLKQYYPPGTRVELLSMNDPYSKLKPGDQGVVNFIDDLGTIFVSWTSGSGLGVVYGVDCIRKIQSTGYAEND